MDPQVQHKRLLAKVHQQLKFATETIRKRAYMQDLSVLGLTYRSYAPMEGASTYFWTFEVDNGSKEMEQEVRRLRRRLYFEMQRADQKSSNATTARVRREETKKTKDGWFGLF